MSWRISQLADLSAASRSLAADPESGAESPCAGVWEGELRCGDLALTSLFLNSSMGNNVKEVFKAAAI